MTKPRERQALAAIYLLWLAVVAAAPASAQDFDELALEPGAKNQTSQLEALNRPERLTVSASKWIRPQSDYNVLIRLENSQSPATVELQLTGARDSDREQTERKSVLVSSGETQTVKFRVKDWPAAEYTLSVAARAQDGSWNFSQEATLNYQPKSLSTLIQTDKAIYKPGELVQFRAVFLTPVLRPLPLSGEVNVTVSDPKRNLVKQWSGLSNWRGLLSLEMQLSEDPPLGDWTITVAARQQEASKQFRVAEYVLPSFEVSLQLPSYVTYDEPDMVATVKASYTYGRPVSGNVVLTVQPLVRFAQLDTRPLQQAQFRAPLVNGSADFSLNLVRELKQQRELFEREVEFFALVEDELTGRRYNRTQLLKMHDKSVKIERLNAEQTFKAGLSFPLRLRVAYQDDTPVEDSGPELELRYGPPGRTLESLKLRPVGGLVEYTIEVPKKVALPALGKSVAPALLEIQATYRGHVHYLNPIGAFVSQSEQYMQISLPQLNTRHRKGGQSSVRVDDELLVRIRATEGMQQVTCHGLAKGEIVWALSPNANNKTELEFNVRLDQRMAPEGRVLCFYVRPENKELIADSASVPVSGLVRNSARLSSSVEEGKPGQQVELDVQTKPNSLVGLLAVDQSVLLLKSGNDISQQDLDGELSAYGSAGADLGAASNTERLLELADVVLLTNNLVYSGFPQPEGRLLFQHRGTFARSQKFRLAPGSIALDSLILDHPLSPPEFRLATQKNEPLVIRSLFPETWIWENATAGSDGVARFKARLPDTITSWSLSAFSINEGHGFGLSRKASVRTFKPFFVRLNLPYSIIRGETVNIQATLFNYLNRPTAAKVTLENRNADFELVEAANNIEDERTANQSESRLVRVPAEQGVSVSFLVRPRRVGQIEIRVIAQGELAGDGVVRKLLVKPEGQPQHFNKAVLISLSPETPTFARNFSIDVPINAVPDSRRVSVTAVGDIMGAGLSNVDDLLRLPYGCGEQNMINLVPNIVILNYLRNTRRLKEAQRVRALRNIETGYQRQLNYKRSDGSFSAFGEQDTNGSVWLTAYVLKTLQQAQPLITVDEQVVLRAANFIAAHSRPDGSIEEVGMLHHKELQSLSSGAPNTYLTAYSMIALLQRPVASDRASEAPALGEVLERGLNHLERRLDQPEAGESHYELAVIAYTLQLANRRASADKAYELLWSKARNDGELVWWDSEPSVDEASARLTDDKLEREFEFANRGPTTTAPPPPLKPIGVKTNHSAHLFVPNSVFIEMTSLALLATVKRGELDRALPIVRWLISQQNSNGGFASTQDTVLAVEALASFANASAASKGTPSIDIDLVYPRTTRQRSEIRRTNVDQLLISNSNALVNQQVKLPDNVTWVQVKASGSGAAVVQVSWQYNLIVSAEKPAFYLNPILDKTSTMNYLQLSVCTFYKAGEASNMALMEVELPSGYVADVEALPGLTHRTREIKRIDTTDGDTKVIIYIDKVTKDEICLTVPAHRTSKVSNNRPVPVTIYDYYNRQQAARIFYEPQQASTCDICDADSCSQTCSKKPKKLEKLISLHEQRKASSQLQGSPSKHANLTATDTSELPRNQSSSVQLLPLAPVLATLLSVARNLYST